MRNKKTMGISYHIDEDCGMTFVRWSGLVTASDFLANTSRVYADAAWPPEKHLHLTNLRGPFGSVSDRASAPEDRRHIQAASGIGRFKVAMVASNFFPQTMVFQRALKSSAFVIVFSALATACTWLDLTRKYAEQRLRTLAPLMNVPSLRRIPAEKAS